MLHKPKPVACMMDLPIELLDALHVFIQRIAFSEVSCEVLIYVLVAVLIVLVVIAVICVGLLLKRKKCHKELLEDLGSRNREITAKTLNQLRNNEVLDSVILKLRRLENNPDNANVNISAVIHALQGLVDDESKKAFDYYFSMVRPGFYDRLQKDYPSLSLNELRLCAFIKCLLCNKEIAVVTGISVDSVKTARKRLRRVFGLTGKNISLLEFLSRY